MSMKKKKIQSVAMIIASYLFIGGIGGFMGYVIGEDAGLNKITVFREYKTKGVIATVNGRDIPQKELKHKMDVFSELNKGQTLTESQLDSLEADYIEYIATTEALYDEAVKQGVKVTDEELSSHYESTMGQLLKLLGITEDRFVSKFNMSTEYVRESLKKELIASKFLTEKVVISDSDVKAEYDKDPSAYAEIRASHILIRDEEGIKKDDELKKEAEEILAKVQNGEDFAELAKTYSKDGSASEGGDLDFFGKGKMVEEFEKAAFSLKVGEVYPSVVKTDFGYHIIKKTDEKENSFEQVKETIQTELTNNAQDKLMQQVIDAAKVEIKLGQNKGKKIQVVAE